MDTKSKSNSRRGILACVAVVLVLTVCFMLANYSGFQVQVENRESYFDQPEFAQDIYLGCYALYWKMAQQEAENLYLTPSDVFFPELRQKLAQYYGQPDDQSVYEEVTVQFNGRIEELYSEYLSDWSEYAVAVLDAATGETMGSADADVTSLLQGENDAALQEALQEKFQYYARLGFGPGGELRSPTLHGVTTEYFTSLDSSDIRQGLLSFINPYSDLYQITDDAMLAIADTVFVFAIPANADRPFYFATLRYEIWSMNTYGYGIICLVMLGLTALLALVMVSRKKLALEGWRAARLAPELSLGLGVLSVALCETPLLEYMVRVYRGSMALDFVEGGAPALLGQPLAMGMLGLWYFAVIAMMFVAAMSLYQLRTLGPLAYLRDRSLLVRGGRWLARMARRLYAWITDIDLTEEGSGRALLKLLVPNCIIMVLLCVVGPVGMVGAAAYSVLLFFGLRKYMGKLKGDYARMMEATRKMAEGELDAGMEGELGVFEPLKGELLRVRDGLQSAVDAEVKSQNMKTELITNVSHDLKTPLTAIITYVDLLKKEDLTEAERAEYVHTLDLKSQRLKHLIDDLFEMSKASSRDITLNLSTMDLQALLRQVQMEAGDELEAAGIELRYNFPEEKTTMVLDGEKTSRVFENLLLNVAKYGLGGTRAYCTVREEGDNVRVEVKNVSQDELNFDNEEITERFVRGDLSRSTEGSGLGLAIAKSFTEAQGGRFWIETDGDMFKAFVQLPKQVRNP